MITKHKAELSLMGISLVLGKIFVGKKDFDLMIVGLLDEKSGGHQSYYSSSCGEYCMSLYNFGCGHISLRCQSHGGAWGKIRGLPKSVPDPD